MKQPSDRRFWLIYLSWILSCILGTLSIETATTLPENVKEVLKNTDVTSVKKILNNSRRIIIGHEAHNLPFMVYLKLPSTNAKFQDYKRWLCAGVIVHEEYILTSAACIEDVKHFYVVSGTYKFSFEDDRFNNPCIKNGAKKAVWKCIPRNYVFDGHENDNIRWMNNDIAIVKLEDEFDFTRRVRGCEFPPRPVCYNNQSAKLEDANTKGLVAGWGSADKYNDWVNSRKNTDQQALQQATVTIMGKIQCKKRWGSRYHNIIENYMICTKDLSNELSEICQEKYVDCTDIMEDSGSGETRRNNPNEIIVHSAYHNMSSRRQNNGDKDGGFCENDHGGPLLIGEGVSATVIGIISACLVKERTNKCYGPFLYTSIYKNRNLLNCAIYKDVGTDCNKLFRASVSHTEELISWSDHPDGPAKNEIQAMRRKEEEQKLKQASETTSINNNSMTLTASDDLPFEKAGVILRTNIGSHESIETVTKKDMNATLADVTNSTQTTLINKILN